MAYTRMRRDGQELTYYQVRLSKKYSAKLAKMIEDAKGRDERCPSAGGVLAEIIRERLDLVPDSQATTQHHD